MKIRKLLPTVLLLLGLTLAAEELTITDEFNTVTLQRSTVAIEDHPEENPWVFEGPTKSLKCSEGTLAFHAEAGLPELRMLSKAKFRSGSLSARLKINSIVEGVDAYMGFLEMVPWHNRSAWVMFNQSANGHLYMKNMNKAISEADANRVRTGNLADGEWHDLKIVLDAKGSELFIDGVSKGRLTEEKAVPHGGLHVFFAIHANGEHGSFTLDKVEVNGVLDKSGTPAVEAFVPPPIPVPALVRETASAVALPQATLTVQADAQGAVLENKYFRYRLSFRNGLEVTEIRNKYIDRNLSTSAEPLFAVFEQDVRLSNAEFAVSSWEVRRTNAGQELSLKLQNDQKKLSATLALTAQEDSPELLVQSSFANQDTVQRTVGVAIPLLGHLQVAPEGDKDEFFYPLASGMAGALECELMQPYGMTLFMQVMCVYNPELNGGLYAYTRETDGYPEIMAVIQHNHPEQPQHSYNVIPWTGKGHNHGQRLFDRGRKGTSLGWRHFEYVLGPGMLAHQPEATIGVNSGLWQAGLKSYADYMHRFLHKPFPTPRWYTECFGMLSGHPYNGLWILAPSKEVGYYNRERQEYAYGPAIGHREENVLQEYAYYWDQPASSELPDDELSKQRVPQINRHQIGDYNYNQYRGGLEALRREIDLIHAKNSHLLLYTHPQGCAKGTLSYELNGKHARMDSPGVYSSNYVIGDMGYNFCNMERGFAEYYSKLFQRLVRETDSDGVRLDVACRVESCYNPAHDHYDGTLRSTVNPRLMTENLYLFKQAMMEISPEKIVTVEHGGNDYISQFHDGFLSENIAWNSETQQWAHFRNLNAYMTVFSRFYFPEVKTWIYGPSNPNLGIQMSLFNAVGFACTGRPALRAMKTLEECADAFDCGAVNTPLIPTLTADLFANRFPGKPGDKSIWTLLNRGGQVAETLLNVAAPADGWHFVELYNDVAVKAEPADGGQVRLSAPVPAGEAAIVACLPNLVDAQKLPGGMLRVNCLGEAGKFHCRVIIGQDDFEAAPQNLAFVDGSLVMPCAAEGKIIVKLYEGRYLRDEIVID